MVGAQWWATSSRRPSVRQGPASTPSNCKLCNAYLNQADKHGRCPVVGYLQQETISTAVGRGLPPPPATVRLSTAYLNQTDEHGGCPVVGSLQQQTISMAGACPHPQQL
jgi:hypothetical protein